MVRPSLLSASFVLLATALPLSAADDPATRAYRQHVAAVCARGADGETSDDLANDFGRIAREVGEAPACGVAPEVAEAGRELQAVAVDLQALLRRAAEHRHRYGDPARVFVEALVRGLVGEPLALRAEIDASRARLQGDLEAAAERWRRCRKALPAAGRALEERCARAFTVCRAALPEEAEVTAAVYLGRARAAAGEQEALIEDCTRQLRADPKNAAAYLLRGAARLSANTPKGAGDDLTEALKLEPDYAFAYALRGRVHAANEEFPEALADCDRALAALPDNVYAVTTRGLVFVKTGENALAVAECTRALRGNPLNGLAYAGRGSAQGALGNYGETVKDCTRAIRLGIAHAWVYYDRGRAHAYRKEYGAALADFNRTLRLAPDCASAYCWRGLVYAAQGQSNRALPDFTHVLRLTPGDASAYGNRAAVFVALGQLDEALADLDEAVRLDPHNPKVLDARARLYYQRGQVRKALQDLDEGLRIDPENAALYAWRALARLRQGEVDQALADCDAALRRDPNSETARGAQQMAQEARAQSARSTPGLPPLSPSDFSPSPGVKEPPAVSGLSPGHSSSSVELPPLPAPGRPPWEKVTAKDPFGGGQEESTADDLEDRYYEAGRSRLGAGAYHEAIMAFDMAIRRDPKDSFAYLKRGLAHAALDEDEEALADFRKVAELDPKNAKAFVCLAMVHLRRKDGARAAAACSEAIRLRPEEAEAWLCRGSAHDLLKEFVPARDDYRQATKLAPSSAAAHNALAWLLATCADAAVRDGARAVEAATRACELSAWNEANIIDTLAAACAECGRFDEAVKWQQKAVDLAPKKDAAEMRGRLDLFKKGKAYRQP